MKGLSIFLSILLCVLLVFGIFLSCTLGVCFNPKYYESAYAQTDTAAQAGVTQDTLMRVTQRVLDYLRGEAYSLDMQEVVDGQLQEVFTQREKDHMVDVRGLTAFAFSAQIFCWTGIALLLIAVIILRKKRAVSLLCRTYLWTFAGFVGVAGCIGAWAVVDFTGLWTAFHHIAFSNDLWLLSASDFLIRMFPESFFSGMVSSILLRTLAILVALLLVAGAGILLGKRHKKRKWEYAMQQDAAAFAHMRQTAAAPLPQPESGGDLPAGDPEDKAREGESGA